MSDRDASVAQVVAICGTDRETAKSVLGAVEWNVEQAVLLFTGGAGDTAAAEEEGVRAPMTAGTARLVEDSGSPGGAGATRRRAYVTPVTAFQDNRPGEGAGAGLKALFQPPHEILTDLPFEDARALAREQRRVLCCNLQVPSDFSSHRLNRDVWSDESVQALVTQGLVLYQQHSNTGEGPALCARYGVSETDPVVLFLDCRTGECLSRLPVEGLTVATLIKTASDVIADQPGPKRRAGAAASSSSSSSSDHSARKRGRATAAEEEERQLKRAMEASLRESGGMAAAEEEDDGFAYEIDDDDEEEEEEEEEEDEDADEDGEGDDDGAASAGPAADEEDASGVERPAGDAGAPRAAASSSSSSSSSLAPPAEPGFARFVPDPAVFIPTSLPAEPAAGGVRLRIGLPGGRRLTRSVLPSDPVSLLFVVASHAASLPHPLAARHEALRAAAAGTLEGGATAEQVEMSLGPLDGPAAGPGAVPRLCTAAAMAAGPVFTLVTLRPSRDLAAVAGSSIGEEGLGGTALMLKLREQEE